MAVRDASPEYGAKVEMPVVPEGYKQTEVGVVPDDWEVAPLGKAIAKLEAGVSVNSVDETQRTYAHDQSVLKTSSIADGRFYPAECKKVAPRDLHRLSLNPEANTLLISRMNTPDLVGECGYVAQDHSSLFLPDRLWITRRRDDSEVDFHWLSYLLSSKPQKSRIKGISTGTSGSMKNISKGSLLGLSIPFPAPREQRAIATALSDVDALLEALDRLIAKKRDIKQATMQQLLTAQTRLPGFEGEWDVRSLLEIADNQKSLFDDGDWVEAEHITDQGIRLVQTGNIGEGTFVEKATRKYINEASFHKLKCKELEEGDILICRLAEPAGRACILPDIGESRVITSVDVTIFRPRLEIADRGFLVQYFSTSDWFKKVLDNVGGTTHKRISRGALGKLKVPFPPVEEQKAIAKVLTDMDADLEALRERRTKTAAIKQALMQELLTGRTRLVEPEIRGRHA